MGVGVEWGVRSQISGFLFVTVRTNRSAMAFIRGVCGAVSTASTPMEANAVSNVGSYSTLASMFPLIGISVMRLRASGVVLE